MFGGGGGFQEMVSYLTKFNHLCPREGSVEKNDIGSEDYLLAVYMYALNFVHHLQSVFALRPLTQLTQSLSLRK